MPIIAAQDSPTLHEVCLWSVAVIGQVSESSSHPIFFSNYLFRWLDETCCLLIARRTDLIIVLLSFFELNP